MARRPRARELVATVGASTMVPFTAPRLPVRSLRQRSMSTGGERGAAWHGGGAKSLLEQWGGRMTGGAAFILARGRSPTAVGGRRQWGKATAKLERA
jgi:hypothetical protein